MSLSADIEGIDQFKASMEGFRAALFDGTALLNIASQARDRVIVRTGAGKDIYNADFTPYSKRYRKMKEDRGIDGSVVDLKLTGQMLSDISLSSEGGEAAIFFNSAESEAKAAYHNGEEADNSMPQRAFFGLSGEDKDYIEGLFNEYADRVVKEANKG
ncbi:MAG: hypothetical protein HZB84_09710 [Deltaproteobacteria bacterium]|nr:hypothetical protein [Deltaproteobacteria bacterium]MBI5903742.1 hypothetical protein [Deltaproteobacteria bacterium]